MRRFLSLIAVLSICAISVGLSASASAPAVTHPATGTKKRCKIVVKTIHHKRRKVRVCHTIKPPPPPPPPPPPQSAAQIVGQVSTGTTPNDAITTIAVGDGSVWAALADGKRIVRIDPVTMKVVATIKNPLNAEWPPSITVGLGSVWVSVAIAPAAGGSGEGAVLRIDEQTNSIAATIPVGRSTEGIGIASSAVWTANHRSDEKLGAPAPHTFTVSRVDTTAEREVTRVPVERRADTGDAWRNYCCGPQGLTVAAGSVWVADATTHAVYRIDPATNAVIASVTTSDGDTCGRLAGDETGVWVASACNGSTLWRIDPARNAPAASVLLQGQSLDVAVGLGSVWATSGAYSNPQVYGSGEEALFRIDPATSSIVGKTDVAGIDAVAVGAGSLWAGAGTKLLKMQPI